MTNAYPLKWPAGWPRTPSQRRDRNGHFQLTFDEARRKLYRELDLLGASNAVLSSNIPLRNDGNPRGDVRLHNIPDPGVAVYFEYRRKAMTMARDSYDNLRDNLLSIVHAISHLRGLERHGGSVMMEKAFEGFAALPAGRSHWDVLGLKPGAMAREIQRAFLNLAKEAHPDQGGSSDAFSMLVQARDVALQEAGT